jgi:hypothetical protein
MTAGLWGRDEYADEKEARRDATLTSSTVAE